MRCEGASTCGAQLLTVMHLPPAPGRRPPPGCLAIRSKRAITRPPPAPCHPRWRTFLVTLRKGSVGAYASAHGNLLPSMLGYQVMGMRTCGGFRNGISRQAAQENRAAARLCCQQAGDGARGAAAGMWGWGARRCCRRVRHAPACAVCHCHSRCTAWCSE